MVFHSISEFVYDYQSEAPFRDARMNYYEELGIDPSATEEEIGRAHRRLARLMHPDQQVDDAVKKLAETQMRRLNAIVEVLTNPEKRQLYDEQLQGKAIAPASGGGGYAAAKSTTLPPMAPPPSFRLGLRRIWRALPWWVWSTAGALAMTFAISWMVADYSGGSFENRPTDYVRPKDETASKEQKQPEPERLPTDTRGQHNALAALNRILAAIEAEKPAHAPKAETPEAKVDADKEKKAQNASAPGKAAEPVESKPAAAPAVSAPAVSAEDTPPPSVRVTKPDNPNPPREVANEQSASPVKVAKAAVPAPLPEIPKPPPVPANPSASPVRATSAQTIVASAALPAVAKPEPKNPLAGDWVYAPKEPEKPVKGYFPPEFIELRLVSERGLLHGQYRARYHVTNAPIQPDVDFQVMANAANSKKFSWESSDGRRGVLKITQVDAQDIEVEWKTTTKSRVPALNVGSATLTRRNVE
jgi:curved DNA-binding protein CbpA